jgi:hypothetical protein
MKPPRLQNLSQALSKFQRFFPLFLLQQPLARS